MVLFGVKDNNTGESLEFRSNPVNLFPSKEEAQDAIKRLEDKQKDGDEPLNLSVVPYTLHRPVIAGPSR